MTFFILMITLAFACSDTHDLTSPDGTVSAVIDGVPWEATIMQSVVYDDVLLNFSVHGGRQDDLTSITLDVYPLSGPGTYVLNAAIDDGDGRGQFIREKDQHMFRSSTIHLGSLTLETLTNERAIGTFYFDAMNVSDSTHVIEVRNGHFDVPVIR